MIFPYYISIISWLVVWNIFYFSMYWEESSQLTCIFFRGLKPSTSNYIPLYQLFLFPTYPSEVFWSWHPQNWQDSLSGSSLSFVEELDNKEKATWRLVGAVGPKNSQVACEFDYGLWFMWMFIVYRTSKNGVCKQTISIWLGGAPPWMKLQWCQEEMIVCKWKSFEHCNNM